VAHEERVREPMSAPPSDDYVREKAEEGWSLVAVEWARPAAGDCGGGGIKEEIPYGLRVAGDCRHLEEDRVEKQVMIAMLSGIVEDKPLSQVAAELNDDGFRTRSGREWTQTGIFYMLPRLIEAAQQIFSSEEWRSRRAEVNARFARLMSSTGA
jgi:hypothetical protein